MTLGDDVVVGPFSVLLGVLVVGEGTWIGPSVTLGTPAEYRGSAHPVGWDGEQGGAGVRIGTRCVLREYVTINQGVEDPTVLGDDCYLMSGSHVGHDSRLGDAITVTSSVQIAGHCEIWSGVNLGLGTLVHQRVVIGPGAMVGMGAVVRKDVDAFSISLGNPARTLGLNRVGLARRGCTDGAIDRLQDYLMGRGPLPDGLPADVHREVELWMHRRGNR